MVEMVLPFGNQNKTFVNPRLGKKIPRGRKEMLSSSRLRKVIFRPNVQLLDTNSGHLTKENVVANNIKYNHHNSNPASNRMYNFTEFEDDKSKHQHNKGMPKATPHLLQTVDSLFMRDDKQTNSNKSVDDDLKILFENLDPEPNDGSQGGNYIRDHSKLFVKSRFKRGVSGSPGSESAADYDKYCGGTFRGLSGIIKSPNYPLYYPNRKHCIYDIAVPDGNDYTIKFTCDDFGVQGTQVTLLDIIIKR